MSFVKMPFYLIQPPPPFGYMYKSEAFRRVLTNYVALLWIEVGQPYFRQIPEVVQWPFTGPRSQGCQCTKSL